MKSIPTEMMNHYTVFIYYSLISDESITVAFGQTQIENSVYEAQFKDRKRKSCVQQGGKRAVSSPG